MTIRLFADHCVSATIISALADAGHDVLRLKDHIPVESRDPIVLETAQRLDALLVSLNGDFADLVTYPPALYGGIICLQLHNQPSLAHTVAMTLVRYMQQNPHQQDYAKQLLLVEPHRIRIRR